MQPLDADPHGAVRHIDGNFALPHHRRFVLTDLVALRPVRIEIIFAVEDGTQVDLRIEAEPGAHRLSNAFLVDHREHAGHCGVNQRDVRIRLSAERGGSAGKQLRLRVDLGMDLHADDDFPIAGRTLDELRSRGLHVHGGPMDDGRLQASRGAPVASRGGDGERCRKRRGWTGASTAMSAFKRSSNGTETRADRGCCAAPSPRLRGEVKKAPYTARTSTTPGTALMAPAICGLTL